MKKKKRKRGRFELKAHPVCQKGKCVQYDVVWGKSQSEPRRERREKHRKRSKDVPSQVFFE